jgi:hypothetical protein
MAQNRKRRFLKEKCMKRKEHILSLINELAGYLLDENPMRLVISLHQEDDGMHLAIMDDNQHSDEEITKMEKALNSQKRPELAGYYGAMTGHDMLGTSRLNLLGWQIKHSDVSRTGNGIKVDLWMGGDRFDSRKFTIPGGEGKE